MKRILAAVIIGLCAAGALWQYRQMHQARSVTTAGTNVSDEWLDLLYSRNPRDVERGTAEVNALGTRALPAIQTTLRDPQAEADRLKSALKAVGILGRIAAPAVPEITAVLEEPGLTAEAAIALSYVGPEAFEPLRAALGHSDPMVRREALRSIGKLKERAPLEASVVLPVLVERMKDPDPTVRAVAATYLGIIHEGADRSVPALIAALSDADPEVRRASAAALGSFPDAAAIAIPALQKASADKHDDVAREAGRSIVKLQGK
jgi:HEAT repeat protein